MTGFFQAGKLSAQRGNEVFDQFTLFKNTSITTTDSNYNNFFFDTMVDTMWYVMATSIKLYHSSKLVDCTICLSPNKTHFKVQEITMLLCTCVYQQA